MTREEQRRNKELKKYLDSKTKEYSKQYDLKKKDYKFYCSNNNMFYSMMFFMNENRIKITFYAKPLWMDDILWDILNMSENKTEPISLRSIGAFTIQSQIKKYDEYVNSTNDIDNTIHNAFLKFKEFVKTFTENEFMKEYKNIDYQKEMINVIILIRDNNFKEALKYLNNNRIHNFIIGNKDFTDLAKEYIEKQ